MKKHYFWVLPILFFATWCAAQTESQAAPVPTGQESPDVLRRMSKLSLMKRGFTEYGEDVKGRTIYYGKEEKKYVYIDEDGLEIALNPANLQMKNGAAAAIPVEAVSEPSQEAEQPKKKKKGFALVNVSADVSTNKSELNRSERITRDSTIKTEQQKTDGKKAATEVKTVRKD